MNDTHLDRLMARLEAADPASRVDLRAVDDTALDALREGILMTPRHTDGTTDSETVPSRRRRSRRALATGGLALALVGGGTAYAASTYAEWYQGGALDGLTCMTAWHDPSTGGSGQTYGGPTLSADPVADCAEYARLTGKPAITDPVAARWDGTLVVGPKAGRPAQAEPVTPLAGAAKISAQARAELQTSLEDYIDGGLSRCHTLQSGKAFAESELKRLGLSGFRFVVGDQQPPEGKCAMIFDHESEPVIDVRGKMGADPADHAPALATQLREQVAQKCLSLPEAQKVTATLLETAGHHWPTSTTVDTAASCTRVDLVIGGSTQVFLYGPEQAKG